MPELKKPRIAVVFTGGTISMRFDPAAGGPVPMLSGAEILAQVPGLDQIADLITIDFARLPGPHMTPHRMLELSQIMGAQLLDNSVDGAVVTHGTDTLEETAYFLDLVLDSEKPVVFVGAMRNSSELGWDGPANLRSAIRVAADPAARGLGVIVAMNDQLIAAAEAIKTHSESVDTFQGRDFGSLGIVDKDRVIVRRRRIAHDRISATRLEERVEIIKLSSGSNGRLLRFAIEDGARGLVIEGLGRGNIPITALVEVERAIRTGIPVILTSRCPRGRILDSYAYEGAARQLKRMGAILGGMLPSHKARIKLMLLLGAGARLEAIRTSFELGD
jgi:L-asparaginase